MINILNMDYRIHDNWCKKIYGKYINKSDRVVVLAYSFRDSQISNSEEWLAFYGTENGIYYRGIVESYQSFGIDESNIIFVDYFNHSTEEVNNLINASSILYLPGGLPTGFHDKINEKKICESILKYNGLIIGCSAGAMIQMDEYFISPDKDYPSFTIESGLGLLSGFGVEAHFDGEITQIESISKYKNITNNIVYAIGDKGILVVENDNHVIYGDVKIF